MRVPRSALRRAARWGSLTTLALIPAAACSADKEPAKGQVMVSFQTDMSVPENVDAIRVQVLQNGIARYNVLHSIGPAPDLVPLPATLAIIAGETNAPVVVRVVGYSAGQARVLRKATVTVPKSRIAHLPMPLHWLCWDPALDEQAPPDGSDSPETFSDFCGDGKTCVAGACVDEQIDTSSLKDYDAKLVFGGANGPGPDGLCTDVLGCFDQGFEVVAQGTPAGGPFTKCAIDLPAGATSDNLNVGLVLPASAGKGICNPGHCMVALDNDPILGWEISGNEVLLPTTICARLGDPDDSKRIDAVAVTLSCPSKTSAVPVCGPWSSVSGTLPTDGGPPQPLDGGMDAESDTSTDVGTDAVDSGEDAGPPPTSDKLGATCQTDQDCDNVLKCIQQAGGLAGGSAGPAGGQCSWPCSTANDQCGNAKAGAVCRQLAPGEAFCVEGCDSKLPFGGADGGSYQCSGRLDMACTTGPGGAGCVPRCNHDAWCTQAIGDAGPQAHCHQMTGLCHSTDEPTGNTGTNCGGAEAGTCTSTFCQTFPVGDAGTAQACSTECILQDGNLLGGNTCGWDGNVAFPPKAGCLWPADTTAQQPGSAGQCMRLCGCPFSNSVCEDNPGFKCIDFATATWIPLAYRNYLATQGATGFCAPPIGPNGEALTWPGGC